MTKLYLSVHDCASLRQSWEAAGLCPLAPHDRLWEAQSYTLRYGLVIGDHPKTCRICYTALGVPIIMSYVM